MQISNNISNNYQSTPTFTSRKPEIKKLDGICRKIRHEFTVMSNTKMDAYSSVAKHPNGYQILGYIDDLIADMRGFVKHIKDPKKGLIAELETVKTLGMGNCNELSNAGYVVCKMNGYKNVHPMQLCAYNQKTQSIRLLDHAVVGINFTNEIPVKNIVGRKFFARDRKAIVMDSWEGFVDYEKNASSQYKHHRMFDGKLKPDEEICYTAKTVPELTKNDLLYFKKQYNSVAKKKKFGLIERIRWYFMDKTKYEAEKFPVIIKESYKRNHNFKNALTQEQLSEMYKAKSQNRLEEFMKEVGRK